MSCCPDMLDALMQSATESIFVVDGETRTIVEAGAAAAAAVGCPVGALVGRSVDSILQHQDRRPLSLCSEGGCPADSGLQCLRLLKRNGESELLNASAIRFRRGQTDFVCLIARKADERTLSVCPAIAAPSEFPTIIGRSIKIRDVCRLIGLCARTDVTVLIQGESGTGKEIVANAVHAHSNRCRGHFVKVNCAALAETLLESELFGHVKGAFTGALRDRQGRFKQADGGTIFLDEIGSMSLNGQAKLLRVLQEHEFEPLGSSLTVPVNVRVIAATNSDLAKAVTEGRFREDLYYRLNVFQIALPSLRERREDVALLAQHFLSLYSKAIGKPVSAFAPETLELLVAHDWPGNVRELENAIEHAVIVESNATISPSSLPADLARNREKGTVAVAPSLRDRLNALEKQMLLDALVRANGVKKRAAAILRIDARNLPYLLRKHDLCAQPGAGNKLH